MAENHLLTLHDIKKDYEGQPLLKGISLEVHTGEVLCLLGRSGSGKSTLLRIIAGIEPPDGGSITWDGEEITPLPTHLRRFGLMFQDYALFPHMNVAENVAFGLRMQKLPRAEIDASVAQALEQVNMGRFASRNVTDLSGGEQQRVALARALAPAPRLLMLDEPLAALDRSLREQLQQELRELLQRSGIPAIYVTHDQQEALALGDRMALLNEGCIVQAGKPEDLFRRPKNRWAAQFLGMTNLYPAEVVTSDPLVVKTPIGQFTAAPSQDLHFTLHEKVWLAVTPAGDFSLEGSVDGNTFRGICGSCLFRGDHYQIQIALADGSSFSYSSSRSVESGQVVILHIPPENLVCLPD